MELATLLLSIVLGILSPAGLILDRITANAIRNQFSEAESVLVRIDNTPSYQLLQGRVDRVRIAGRGLYLQPEARIAVLEVETDAIALAPGNFGTAQTPLEQPAQAAIRLVLTEVDINRFLQSPAFAETLRDRLGNIGGFQGQQLQRYTLVDPQVEFLAGDRIRFQAIFQDQEAAEQLAIVAESGLTVVAGRQLQLVNPQVIVDGEPVSPVVIGFLTAGISRFLDLGRIQERGILARLLQLEINEDELSVAAFVRVEPAFLTQTAD